MLRRNFVHDSRPWREEYIVDTVVVIGPESTYDFKLLVCLNFALNITTGLHDVVIILKPTVDGSFSIRSGINQINAINEVQDVDGFPAVLRAAAAKSSPLDA